MSAPKRTHHYQPITMRFTFQDRNTSSYKRTEIFIQSSACRERITVGSTTTSTNYSDLAIYLVV